jgi:hypothetical protein
LEAAEKMPAASPDPSKLDVIKRQLGDVHCVAPRFIAISKI